jgi:hypothetical protein
MLLSVRRHGLRASEACDLEWSDIDLGRAEMHIRRAKLGKPAVHPIRGHELRALRRLQREQKPKSTFVFTTERGGPMTPDALNRMVKRLGGGSKLLGFPHPCPHASARVRLQIGQRWPRHSIDPGLPRAQVDHVNGALHGIERHEVQKCVEVKRTRASRQEKKPQRLRVGQVQIGLMLSPREEAHHLGLIRGNRTSAFELQCVV